MGREVIPAGIGAASQAVRESSPQLARTIRWSRPPAAELALHYGRHVNPLVRAQDYVRAAMSLVNWRPERRGMTSGWTEGDDPFVARVASYPADGIAWGRAAANVMVAGEVWIRGQWAGPNVMDWHVGSISEVRWSQGDDGPPSWHTAGSVDGVPLWRASTPVEQRPTLVRCWYEDLEYSDVAWSTILGDQAQAICEQILVMQMAELAASKSRLSNGVLFVPNEVVAQLRTMTADGKMIADPGIKALLQDQMTRPIEDPQSVEGVVPLVIFGPAAAGGALQHLTLSRLNDPSEFVSRYDHLVKDLAMLLPVPEMVLRGLADQNHWNGALEDDNAVKFYWQPMARILADAVTEHWLRPYLKICKAAGVWRGDPFEWRIAGDCAALAERPADATVLFAGYDKGAWGDKYVRAKLGVPEDAAPDAEEWAKWKEVSGKGALAANFLAGGPAAAPALGPGPPDVQATATPSPPEPLALPVGAAAAPVRLPAQKAPSTVGGMVAVTIPVDVAAGLAIDGYEAPEDMHVTLVVFELGVDRRTVMDVIGSLDLPTAAMDGTVGGIGRFPASPSSDGLDPVWCPVDTPGLAELRAQVVDALGVAGIAMKGDHGWTPHATVAYLDSNNPTPPPYPSTPVTFDGLVVCVGPDRWSFPFVPVAVSDATKAKAIDVAPVAVRSTVEVMDRIRAMAAPVVAAKARAEVAGLLGGLSGELNRIDAECRAALAAMCDARLASALSAAGRKVITAANQKTGPRRAPKTPDQWAQAVVAVAPPGTDPMWALDVPGVVAALGLGDDIIERVTAAFHGFADQVRRVLVGARTAAARAITAAVGTAPPERPVDEAVDMLTARLQRVAAERATSTEEGGPARAVAPWQLVAAAVAVAGGWTVTASRASGVVPGSIDVGRMAGGVAASSDLRDFLALTLRDRVAALPERAVVATVWTWQHDHPQHPYEPHVRQHGRTAASLDDFDGLYPGDHRGCRCIVRPEVVLGPPGGVRP